MNAAHSWLKSILCFATFVLLVSCASYIPTDSTVGNMSVQQARNVVTTELKRFGYTFVRFTSKKMVAGGFVYKGHTSDPEQITYSEITQIYQRGAAPEQIIIRGQDKQLGFFYIRSNPRDFTSALYVLKQNAIKQQIDAAENDTIFAASLADHRNKIASNAALPEEANKYKVQAEGAVRDKEFFDAADLYAAALKIAPWWPVGHFNRALVLGESGDYEMAKREMNYYLQLVPGAPNARAAQDKIYEWERKAGEGS